LELKAVKGLKRVMSVHYTFKPLQPELSSISHVLFIKMLL